MANSTPSEDLFEDSKMTFGEHLEELRGALFRSLIGVAVGCVIGLYFSNQIVQVLQKPLTKAIERFKVNQAQKKLLRDKGYVSPTIVKTITERGLIPRTVAVSHDQAIEVAGKILGSGNLTLPPSAIQFRVDQLPGNQSIELAKALVNGKSDDPFGYVLSRLDEGEQNTVQAIAMKEEANEEAKTQLVAILNRLLDDETLLESESLAKVREVVYPKIADRSKDGLFAEQVNTNEAWVKIHRRQLNEALLLQAMSPYLSTTSLELIEFEVWETVSKRPQALGTEEPFMIWMKTGLIAGVVIAGPWIFYQLWLFVAAGMYPHEKKYVYIYLPFSLILFLIGALFAFYVVFRFVLDFLFTFYESMGLDPEPRIGSYLGFVLILPLGFGIAFQLPLVMLFLHRIGLFSINHYIDKWRISVLIIFVVSMVLTPSDPISMLLMALPLSFLYFFGILLCYWMPRSNSRFNNAYDPT